MSTIGAPYVTYPSSDTPFRNASDRMERIARQVVATTMPVWPHGRRYHRRWYPTCPPRPTTTTTKRQHEPGDHHPAIRPGPHRERMMHATTPLQHWGRWAVDTGSWRLICVSMERHYLPQRHCYLHRDAEVCSELFTCLLFGLNCHSCSCASMTAVGQKLTSSTQPQIGHTAR